MLKERVRCSICGNRYYSVDCEHIVDYTYTLPDGTEKKCLLTVHRRTALWIALLLSTATVVILIAITVLDWRTGGKLNYLAIAGQAFCHAVFIYCTYHLWLKRK